MSREWWEPAPDGEYGVLSPEVLVRAVEALELQGLADPLGPRSEGAIGLAAHMRKMFAPAFEQVREQRKKEDP